MNAYQRAWIIEGKVEVMTMQPKEKAGWEPKSRLSGALVFISLILFGALAGWVLCRLMAPGSETAYYISALMLPVSMVAGTLIWQTIVLVFLGLKLGGTVLKGFRKGGVKGALNQKVEDIPPFPPGTFIFILVSAVVCLIAGTAVAFMQDSRSMLGIMAVYGLTGLVYGFLQRRLIRAGYFVTLESGTDTVMPDKKKHGP